MAQIDRFSVSLDSELLAAFDRHIAGKGYNNRSEAIRDLIRDLLTSVQPAGGTSGIVAVLTAFCDHRVTEVWQRYRSLLVQNEEVVIGATHWPIDENHDLITVALGGDSDAVDRTAKKITSLRGIEFGQFHAVVKDEL